MYMRKLLDYVKQDRKTMFNGEWLVTGIDCGAQNTFADFMRVKKDYGKADGRYFYHLDQSFHPDEVVTPHQAHEIGVKLAEFYKGFQVVVATHIDKDHLHSHILVNSVSFEDGRKLRSPKDALEQLRKLSDELCRNQGLSTLSEYKTGDVNSKLTAREYRAAVNGESWKFTLIHAIDDALIRSGTRQEFIENMKYEGISVKWIPDYKYMTYTLPDGKRCRDNKLHNEQYLKANMERLFDYREEYDFEPFTKEPDEGWQAVVAPNFEPLGIGRDLVRLGKELESIPQDQSHYRRIAHEDSKVRQREKIKMLAAGHKLRDELEQEQRF